MNLIGPVHYRLSDHWTEDGRVQVEATKYYVLKETPRGYWVISEWAHKHLPCFPELADKNKRWTPKIGGRYCQPSLAEAKRHYSIRKRHELRHLEARLDKCRQVLGLWEKLTVEKLEFDSYIDLGHIGPRLLSPFDLAVK